MTDTLPLTPAQHVGLARARSMTAEADHLSKQLRYLSGPAKTTTAAKIVRLHAESLSIRNQIAHLDPKIFSSFAFSRRAAIDSRATQVTLTRLESDRNARVQELARRELARRESEFVFVAADAVPAAVVEDFAELFSS